MKALVIVPAVAAVLALSACGGDTEGGDGKDQSNSKGAENGEKGKDKAPEATGTIADVKVSGAAGKPPKIEVPKDFFVGKTESKVLDAGDGAKVDEGQDVVVDYLGVVGRSGEKFDSSWDRKQSAVFTLENGSLIPGFVQGLAGKNIGDRVLITIPSKDGYGNEAPEGSVIKGGDSLVFVVELKDIYKPMKQASGEAVTPEAGLPEVETDSKGAVTDIKLPDGDAPKETVVQPLIIGDGEKKVGKNSTLTFHLQAVNWRTGKTFESSWSQGQPYTAALGQVPITGLVDNVVGQPVGSRILLVLPPEDGFGTELPDPENPEGEPVVKKDDTVVMVIDLLEAH